MFNQLYRPTLERLEQRQLLTASLRFVEGSHALGTNHDAIEVGDLDGDRDLDVIVICRNLADAPSCSGSQVWLNDGSGQYYAGWRDRRTGANEVVLGDVDNDGDLDAFITKASPFGSQPNEVWLNDGHGNFSDSGQRLSDIARDVVLGDVDGDGDLDAVTASIDVPSKVWLNDGSGHFTNSGQRLAPDGWSFSVALGDVDGDGDLDAWFGRGTDSSEYVDRLYFNDGLGNFTDSGQRLNVVSTGDVQFGDLDGDADLDAYLVNGEQRGNKATDRVWINDGTGQFADSGQRLGRVSGRSVGATGRSVELGDFDGDGDLDAVVANGATLGSVIKQPNEIWLNDGSGAFTVAQIIGNAATTAAAIGDVDNDGDLDVLFANLGQNNQVWFNRLAGDVNDDGHVEFADFLALASNFGRNDAFWEHGDLNTDGAVDFADFLILSDNYGKSRPRLK